VYNQLFKTEKARHHCRAFSLALNNLLPL